MMKLQLGPATPTHLDATTLKKKPKLLIFKIAPLNPSLSLGNRKRPHLCRRDEWMQLPPPKSNRHIKGSHRKRGHLPPSSARALPSPSLCTAPKSTHAGRAKARRRRGRRRRKRAERGVPREEPTRSLTHSAPSQQHRRDATSRALLHTHNNELVLSRGLR